MIMPPKKPYIKIIKDGPFVVSGNVELTEKIIESHDNDYKMKDARKFNTGENYLLCRCGKSKNMPFCDGAHTHEHFKGTETASRLPYLDRARIFKGPSLILADDDRCAFARFCHTTKGDAWQLIMSDAPEAREYAIKAATECPAGRLTVYDAQTKELIEPYLEPSISIIQDPQRGVSGPIWVKGNIPIESSNGEVYEIRNRVTLCRCGKSRNKPFCDAMHVSIGFTNK